ncbi:MAG: FAD-dependent oxidoreductase [Syntrophorhabdaceae bacterium]|nr:FAD-dependent oxidoreductase [Syntrophorhabdaceae bacterium]MDD4195576.1 FAD-dependent oxidoreductase [Syntrophorhabdaceae bacterium]
MDKIDAIVVGGGLAGLSAAYKLAEAGKQVILLERGDAPGSKNVTGGRIYVGPVRKYLPEIMDSAPFERHVVKEMVTVLDDTSALSCEYTNKKWRQGPYMSYTVLRARFDSWFADQAAAKGAFIIPKKKVESLLWEDGKVAGIKSGPEEIGAHVVIAADGALSFMAEQAGMRGPHKPQNLAVAVKEIYQLDEKVIEDRFGLENDEGAAGLYMGSVTQGMFGGGFLYTNRDTLSVGLVLGIHQLASNDHGLDAPSLMESFTGRPEIRRFIKGGELKEYSAHIISEAGIGTMPKLVAGGMLIAGDAAGFALNLGLTVRGMEFAIASGVMAAETAIEALNQNDTSAATLSGYEKRLRESFVLPDMETFRNAREVLDRQRLFTVYPRFICELFDELFTIDDGPKEGLYASAKRVAKKYVLNIDTIKDLLAARKL